MSGAGGTGHEDRRAGLRFVAPPRWRIVPHDPEDEGEGEGGYEDGWSPTTTAIPSPSGEGIAVARDPWDPHFDTDEDGPGPGHEHEHEHQAEAEAEADAWFAGMLDQRGIWVGLWEGLPEDPPDEDGLLEAAEWLADQSVNLEYLAPPTVHGREFRARRMTVHGRPAAGVWARFAGDEDDGTAAYLRLLLLQLADGRLSFVFGVAQSDADRQLVDDCLDSVEPIAGGSAG
ncbi:hypothetical protein ACTWP5_11225 [Streptomyces sp. 4N509B]|uniref:hypothetical protein n=1 Tax=Streptomyces sp. 4N509B TaxID=3457413 RepID=UPI003FD2E29D